MPTSSSCNPTLQLASVSVGRICRLTAGVNSLYCSRPVSIVSRSTQPFSVYWPLNASARLRHRSAYDDGFTCTCAKVISLVFHKIHFLLLFVWPAVTDFAHELKTDFARRPLTPLHAAADRVGSDRKDGENRSQHGPAE